MSLPVTRTFSGAIGVVPTVDETQWAYNRAAAIDFGVRTSASGYINSNDRTVDTMMHWTGDSFNANQYAEIVLYNCTGSTTETGYGLGLRLATGSTQKTGYRLITNTAGWWLSRFINGTHVLLASGTSPTFTLADIVYGSVSGIVTPAFTLRKNGIQFGAGTVDSNATPLTSGAPGIVHSSTSNSNDGIDTWTGGNSNQSLVVSSGSFVISGLSTILRPGSLTYLRYKR